MTSDQRVRKGVALVAGRRLVDELCADRALQCVDEVVLSEVAEALEQLERERVAEDRRRLEHAAGLRAQARETASDKVPDAVGQRQLARRPQLVVAVVAVGVVEVARDLDDEEREPVRLGEDHPAQVRRRPAVRVPADELRDRGRVEAVQRYALDELLAGEVREHAAERVLGVDVRVAIGGDDQEPGLTGVASRRTSAAAASTPPPSAGRRGRAQAAAAAPPRTAAP